MYERMSERLTPYSGVLTVAAILLALGGGAAAKASHAKKNHAPKPPEPQLLMPPPVDYVRCAAGVGGNPCELDPAMQRLNGNRSWPAR